MKSINEVMMENKVNIKREWAMPNSRTFTILPIRNLISKYVPNNGIVLDPFANECSIKSVMNNTTYISNDLNTIYNCNFSLEAQDFLKMYDDNSIDLILYDPPYSGRQVSECYTKLGKTVNMEDTNSGYWTKFKTEITRVLKVGGICISFGWNTNGIGRKNGFKIKEILLVPHGGEHYDTLCTVEVKEIHRLKFDI